MGFTNHLLTNYNLQIRPLGKQGPRLLQVTQLPPSRIGDFAVCFGARTPGFIMYLLVGLQEPNEIIWNSYRYRQIGMLSPSG